LLAEAEAAVLAVEVAVLAGSEQLQVFL